MERIRDINNFLILKLKIYYQNQDADTSKLKDFLRRYIDEQAVRSSQIDFGVVTVELKSMATRFVMKNQIPEGQLLDYIMASASLFPAMKSYEIGKENLSMEDIQTIFLSALP